MKPQDFMTLAEDLLKNRGKFSPELAEAIYRTALSRLYYGMLHWIQQRYRISVPTTKSSVYHAHAIEELEKIADDEVLVEFNFLKFKRIEADYLLEKVIGSRECQDCIVSKQKLLRLIEEHPQISFDGDAGDFKKTESALRQVVKNSEPGDIPSQFFARISGGMNNISPGDASTVVLAYTTDLA